MEQPDDLIKSVLMGDAARGRITSNTVHRALEVLGEDSRENRIRIAAVLNALKGRLYIDGAVINEVIGPATTERLRFLQHQALTIDPHSNCTQLALHLIGNREPIQFYEEPLAGLWTNESPLLLPQAQDHSYRPIPALYDRKGLYHGSEEGYFPEGNRGSRFHVRANGAMNSVRMLHCPLPSWEKFKELLEQEEVVSLLSYKLRDNVLLLDTFYHMTLCATGGRFFVIDTAPYTHLRTVELTPENYAQVFKIYERGVNLLAVGGHDMPPAGKIIEGK